MYEQNPWKNTDICNINRKMSTHSYVFISFISSYLQTGPAKTVAILFTDRLTPVVWPVAAGLHVYLLNIYKVEVLIFMSLSSTHSLKVTLCNPYILAISTDH